MKIKTVLNKFSFWLLAFCLFGSPVINFFNLRPVYSIHKKLAFPIIGSASFSNDYNAPRASGPHHAIDIFAPKHRKIIAVHDGIITYAPVPQPSWGYMVTIRDDEGYRYNYIHLNNDKPGTDDGNGGPMNAYAPYVKPGNRVIRGQHIGYLGDSGNAEETPPHLHFEIEKPNGEPINPYTRLVEASRISAPVEPRPYPFEILPYGFLKSGLNVAVGNFDADINSEILTAPGEGGGPRVRIFETNGDQVVGLYVLDPDNRDGVDVAAGDVDGDNVDEIIVGPGPGSGPYVRIFEANGTHVASFFAYSQANRDGIRVAAGDVDNDGEDEIITSPMAGSGPSVKVFEINGSRINNFLAYDSANRDGVDVAAGDVDADGIDEIITGAGRGSGPSVKVFEANGTKIDSFLAYGPSFRGGVRVGSGNVRITSQAHEMVTVTETGVPRAKLFSGTGSFLSEEYALESWWLGYNDIGAGRDLVMFATGTNRRAALIEVLD